MNPKALQLFNMSEREKERKGEGENSGGKGRKRKSNTQFFTFFHVYLRHKCND